MTTISARLRLPSLTLALCLAACDGGSDPPAADLAPGPDLAPPVPDAGDVDLAMPDLAEPADLTAGTQDLLTDPPAGTRIAEGFFVFVGLTSDDHAVFFDRAVGGLRTVPVAGGAVQTIDAISTDALIIGATVFSWGNVDRGADAGDLTVWSAATGAQRIATRSVIDLAGVSADGAYVIYTTGANVDGTAVSIQVAQRGGAGKHTLATGALISFSCTPRLGFAGGRALYTYCPAAMGGSTVASADPATGQSAVLLAGARNFWAADAAGTRVLVITNQLQGQVYPLAGGAGTTIDTDVFSGALVAGGADVVYRNMAMKLRRSDTTTPAPQDLVSSGVTGFHAFSRDEKYLLYFGARDANTGLTDIRLASLTPPGSSVTLEPGTTGGVYGDAYSGDGSRALFFTGVDAARSVGTLKSVPLAGGSAVTHASGVWQVFALTGTRVAYNDNVQGQWSDIRVLDTVQGVSTLVAKQADVDFRVTGARDRAVYNYGADANLAGVYVVPIP